MIKKLSNWAATLCLVHCIATVVMAATSFTLVHYFDHWIFEVLEGAMILVVVVSALAQVSSRSVVRSRILLLIGAVLALGGHIVLDEVITILGLVIFIGANWWSKGHCEKESCAL